MLFHIEGNQASPESISEFSIDLIIEANLMSDLAVGVEGAVVEHTSHCPVRVISA